MPVHDIYTVYIVFVLLPVYLGLIMYFVFRMFDSVFYENVTLFRKCV